MAHSAQCALSMGLVTQLACTPARWKRLLMWWCARIIRQIGAPICYALCCWKEQILARPPRHYSSAPVHQNFQVIAFFFFFKSEKSNLSQQCPNPTWAAYLKFSHYYWVREGKKKNIREETTTTACVSKKMSCWKAKRRSQRFFMVTCSISC